MFTSSNVDARSMRAASLQFDYANGVVKRWTIREWNEALAGR